MSDNLLEPYINSIVDMIINATGAFEYLDASLKNNKELMCRLVSKSDRFMSQLPEVLLNDKDVALSAVAYRGSSLRYMSNEFRNDFDIVTTAVSQDGWALQYASPEYRRNRQIVELAIADDGTSIRYADLTLKEDKSLVLKAVASNGAAIQYLIDRFKYDRDLVLMAVNQKNPHILSQIPQQFTYDMEIVLSALYHSPNNRDYLPSELEDASEILFLSDNRRTISPIDWPMIRRALVQAPERFFNPPTLLEELADELPSKYLIFARYALGDNSYISDKTCDIGDFIV